LKDKLSGLPSVCNADLGVPFDQLVGWGLEWLRQACPKPLPLDRSVSCPNSAAHTGAVVFGDQVICESHAGLIWDKLCHIAAIKWQVVEANSHIVPEVVDLLSMERSPWLDELYGVGIGFLRKDGGPTKPRLVVNCPKDAYINEIPFLKQVYSPDYKLGCYTMAHASNVTMSMASARDMWKHSGDWSEYDLRNLLVVMVAALVALGQHLGCLHDPNYRAAAYRAVAMPVWYLGELHEWWGRSKSGSGLFVIINNICNAIYLAYINYRLGVRVGRQPQLHGDDLIQYLLKRLDEDGFSNEASAIKLKAKASQQFCCRDAALACRAIHSIGDGFRPRAIMASVIRNFNWPGYDPFDLSERSIFKMALRYRDLKKTLISFHPNGRAAVQYIDSLIPDAGLPWLTDEVISSYAQEPLSDYRLFSRLSS
jgi:hypothetical protein